MQVLQNREATENLWYHSCANDICLDARWGEESIAFLFCFFLCRTQGAVTE